jgi:hypothetical protein
MHSDGKKRRSFLALLFSAGDLQRYWPGIREFLASGVQRPWHRDWL